MLSATQRNLALFACLFAICIAMGLYASTGLKVFSRGASPELAESNGENDLADLFGEIDPGADEPALGSVDTEYRFGLFPGGTSLPAFLSVVSITGPALTLAFAAILLSRPSKHSTRETA
ncbi:MAG: hypothetical protein AAGB51_04990 [Planctomycetota bacterium]